MSIFSEVGLTWRGKEYIVAPDRVMGLIEVIEDAITIEELDPVRIKRGALSRAYCNALVYAGCKDVTVEAIYCEFFGDDSQVSVSAVISSLITMMVPPKKINEIFGEPDEAAKKKPSEGESD